MKTNVPKEITDRTGTLDYAEMIALLDLLNLFASAVTAGRVALDSEKQVQLFHLIAALVTVTSD